MDKTEVYKNSKDFLFTIKIIKQIFKKAKWKGQS